MSSTSEEKESIQKNSGKLDSFPNINELLRKTGYDTHHPLGEIMNQYVNNCKINPDDFHAWASFAQFFAEIGPNVENEATVETLDVTESNMKKEAVVMYEKALSLIDEALLQQDNFPLRTSYYYYMSSLASLLEEIKEYDKCEYYYKKVLEADPNHPVAVGNYAFFLHRKKKQPLQAEKFYERSCTVHPLHASVISKFGSFQKSIHNNDSKAESYYQKAVDACPTNVESLGAYAVFLHSKRKDLDKADMLYRQALELDPEHVNILTNYGLFLSEIRNEYHQSKVMYQRALAIDPTHANCLYNLAVLFDSGLQDHKKAEALYRLALQSNSRHAYALYNLAILLEEKITNQVQIISNSEQVITVGSVRVQKEKKNYQPVKELFQKCIALTQSDVMTLSDYGRFLFLREKEFKKGEEILRKAIQYDKSYAPAFFYLGMLLLHQYEHANMDIPAKVSMEIERWLKRTLSINSRHSGAYTLLGRLYSKNPKKTKQAEDNYNKALEISPNNIELLIEFSKFLTIQKETASKDFAKELMRRAASLENIKTNSNRKTYTSEGYNIRQQAHCIENISPLNNTTDISSNASLNNEESSEETFAQEVFGYLGAAKNNLDSVSTESKRIEDSEDDKPKSLSSFIDTESKYEKPLKYNKKPKSTASDYDGAALPKSALDLVEISSPSRKILMKPVTQADTNSPSKTVSSNFSPNRRKTEKRVLNGPDDLCAKSRNKEKTIEGNEKDLKDIAAAVKSDFKDFNISELAPLSEVNYKNQFANDLKGIQSAISQLISVHTSKETTKPLPYKESKYTASVNIPVLPSNILASAASPVREIKKKENSKVDKSPTQKRRAAPLPPTAVEIIETNQETGLHDPLLSSWTTEAYDAHTIKEY